jgi:hypothetical protein
MEGTPDRAAVIDLLEKLGESDDSEALAAARDLHGLVSGSGLTWDDLLVPDGEAAGASDAYDDSDDNDLDDDDVDEGEEEEAGDSELDEQVVPTGETADDIKLIDSLLERKDISAALREELEGYKEDIKEGDFTASDRQYLGALQKRLSGTPKKRAKEA